MQVTPGLFRRPPVDAGSDSAIVYEPGASGIVAGLVAASGHRVSFVVAVAPIGDPFGDLAWMHRVAEPSDATGRRLRDPQRPLRWSLGVGGRRGDGVPCSQNVHVSDGRESLAVGLSPDAEVQAMLVKDHPGGTTSVKFHGVSPVPAAAGTNVFDAVVPLSTWSSKRSSAMYVMFPVKGTSPSCGPAPTPLSGR